MEGRLGHVLPVSRGADRCGRKLGLDSTLRPNLDRWGGAVDCVSALPGKSACTVARTVLLDVNLWSYVARQDLAAELAALEDRFDFRILLHPAALMEALSTGDPRLRQSVVAAMRFRRRPTLRTEAAEEADEFVREVRRLRPQWLTQFPHKGNTSRLERFWTRDVWRQAEEDAAKFVHSRTAQFEDRRTEAEVNHQIALGNQSRAREEGVRLDPADLFLTIEGPPLPGLSAGDTFEFWRANFHSVFWHNLAVRPRRKRLDPTIDTTYADWISPYVSLSKLASDKADFNRFCFYEVDAVNVPRIWIRNALDWVHLNWKVAPSAGWDNAHAAYTVDADIFLTADKRLTWALAAAREIAPVAFAETRLVEHVEPVTNAIAAAMDR